MGLYLIFLSCLLITSQAQNWGDISLIFTGSEIAYNPTTLMDAFNKRLHSIFSVISEQAAGLAYVYTTLSGDVSDVYRLFTNTSYMFLPKHDLAVINSGSTLFAALTVMTDRETAGVYYTETTIGDDANFTDLKSIVSVPDQYLRAYPTVLYSKELDRLWVFYYKFLRSGMPSICYVTRPKGSVVFSSEKTILTNVYPTSFILVNYTVESHSNLNLHMFWTMRNESDQSSDLIYMKSKDNGVRWSFAYIADVVAESRWEPIDLALDGPLMVVSNVDNNGAATNVRLTISKNGGDNWKTYEYAISQEDPNQKASIALGKYKGNNGIFAFSAFFRMNGEKKENIPKLPKGNLKFVALLNMLAEELIPPLRNFNPEIVAFPEMYLLGNIAYALGSMCKENPFAWCEFGLQSAVFP